MNEIAKITVGKVAGGHAAWCATCKSGKAALTGIDQLDQNVLSILVAGHEAWHANGLGNPWL